MILFSKVANNLCSILKIANKNIITYYSHYIMEQIAEIHIECDLSVDTNEITLENIDQLDKLNGFDISYLKKELKKGSKIFGIYAYTDDKIIGYVWCALKGGKDRQYLVKDSDIYIFDVFTDSRFRGHNIAPYLINLLTKKYASDGSKIRLAVRKSNTSAIRAYQKIGFSIVSEKNFCVY